jgi:hypothetical protein
MPSRALKFHLFNALCISVLLLSHNKPKQHFKMRVTFLFAFLIASSSAFAPLANGRRSHSVFVGGQAVKASPVRAGEKSAPGKKKANKASPPMKQGVPPSTPSKASPVKGSPPGKTSPMKGGKPKAKATVQPAAKKLFGIS